VSASSGVQATFFAWEDTVVQGRGDLDRSKVIREILELGLAQPIDKALMTSALSAARRGLAALGEEPPERRTSWMDVEVRLGGVRRNAALIVGIEDGDLRAEAQRLFAECHPGELKLLEIAVTLLG
jgi:hypothetical protein